MFFSFPFSLVRWIAHDDLRVMFTLEMVLDEFPCVTFMEQDTNCLSYELGLVTEFRLNFRGYSNCIMYKLIFAKLASKTIYALD